MKDTLETDQPSKLGLLSDLYLKMKPSLSMKEAMLRPMKSIDSPTTKRSQREEMAERVLGILNAAESESDAILALNEINPEYIFPQEIRDGLAGIPPKKKADQQ